MNLKIFFDKIRPLFGGKMNQSQVDGINFLYDNIVVSEIIDKRMAAYIFATVFHETAKTMQPIEEIGKGKNKEYGKPDPVTGHTYYGRGYVQLTWKYNYDCASRELEYDFVNNPDAVMQPDNAVVIMVKGMSQGWFTGKKLSDYFNLKTDFVGARKIINGTDKAEVIGGYAKSFYDALNS